MQCAGTAVITKKGNAISPSQPASYKAYNTMQRAPLLLFNVIAIEPVTALYVPSSFCLPPCYHGTTNNIYASRPSRKGTTFCAAPRYRYVCQVESSCCSSVMSLWFTLCRVLRAPVHRQEVSSSSNRPPFMMLVGEDVAVVPQCGAGVTLLRASARTFPRNVCSCTTCVRNACASAACRERPCLACR